MALIQCPECKNSIAEDAKQCPKCGHPFDEKEVIIKETTDSSRDYGWGTFIYFIIFIAGIFLLLDGKLIGLLFIIFGAGLIVARYKLWSRIGKKIR